MKVEEFKKLKVGDRIIATENTWARTKNVCGTVVSTQETSYGYEITIKWDKNVLGWDFDEDANERGNGEYMSIGNPYVEVIKKLDDDIGDVYRLVIECKDGVNTTATYTINGKTIDSAKTRRNVNYDDFDFNVAVDNCIDRLRNKKGKALIGRTIKKGQRIRIINVNKHKEISDSNVCIDEYIGKTGIVNHNFTVGNSFGSSITFDEEYMNAIDKKNGKLCYHWSEFELL